MNKGSCQLHLTGWFLSAFGTFSFFSIGGWVTVYPFSLARLAPWSNKERPSRRICMTSSRIVARKWRKSRWLRWWGWLGNEKMLLKIDLFSVHWIFSQTWYHRPTSKYSSNEGLKFKESPHTVKPVWGRPKWERAESKARISRGSAFVDLLNLGSLSSLSRPR